MTPKRKSHGLPLVSVLCFCRNAARTIKRCIDSIMNQDYPNIEVIVQDGASSDGTLEILRSYGARINLVSEADDGPGDAMFRCLNRVSGEIFTTCLSDEAMLSHAVSWGVEKLKQHPGAGAIYGDHHNIDLEGHITGLVRPQAWDFEKVLCSEFIPPFCTSFFKRECYERTGLKAYTNCGEFEIWIRLGMLFPIVHVPGLVAQYGVHEGELSFQAELVEKQACGKTKVLERFFDEPDLAEEYRRLKEKALAGVHTWLLESYCNMGQWDKACDYFYTAYSVDKNLRRLRTSGMRLLNHGLELIKNRESLRARRFIALPVRLPDVFDNIDLRPVRRIFSKMYYSASGSEDLPELMTHNGDGNINTEPAEGSNSELDRLIAPEILNDAFYDDIERLSSEEGVEHILEIGSSAGQGSTSAFDCGITAGGSRAKLYCMEISEPRYCRLLNRYRNNKNIHCYRASSVPVECFSTENEIIEFYQSTRTGINRYPLHQVLGWLKQDKEYLERSDVCKTGIQRIKLDHGIKDFDIVLIDGSEFTGKAEMEEIYGAKIILLDDINSFKNHHNYHRLVRDPAYRLEKENWNLRNGYAIFRRRAIQFPPVNFFTIVLNGEPFIRYHLDILKELNFSWHWHIIEGVADLKRDTSWSLKNGGYLNGRHHCNGLSIDGTTAYLDQIKSEYPDRITLYRKKNGEIWNGKLEMVNAPIVNLREECLLWQIDADELWTADQIKTVRSMFQTAPDKTSAFFYCHFFVGPDRVTITRDTYGNHSRYEWLRVWRYSPGDIWQSHEPPRLVRPKQGGAVDVGTINPFSHAETESNGLVFQHYAYAIEAQVDFKEAYYGYKNAVRQWKKLQGEHSFPIKLKRYFAWVKDETQVAAIQSQGITPLMTLEADVPASGSFAGHEYRSILWVRTDSIGDAVLAAGMLPVIRKKYPQARITVVCQELCRELYDGCPSIDGVITIPNGHRWHGAEQFSQFLNDVKRVAPDLLLNSVYSLHGVSDIPKLDFIPKRIAMRRSPVIEYTDIIDTPRGCLAENDRHKAFLIGLGIHNCPSLDPVMWLNKSDHGFADAIFSKYAFEPQQTIAVFVGSRIGIKQYFQWGKALSRVCQERNLNIIALGAKEDRELSQWQLEIINRPAINLCGNTTLRQAAAILSKCRLAAGTDTSLAHMACAMGTDNVVVVGGGHFGRFFPYSSQTIVVCNPMDCFGCDWRCLYPRPKCIQEIEPEFIGMAIDKALEGRSAKRRVFAHTKDPSILEKKTPAWFMNSQGVMNPDLQITYRQEHEKISPAEGCHGESGASGHRQFDDAPPGPAGLILVSAIVSAYNSEKFIKGCLEDLEAQTIADQLEIIVIDSGSQQNECRIVKEFQARYSNIRYVRTEVRESVYAAWNRGIKIAEGKYITNANTDDRHRRDALERMVAILETQPEIDLVYADVIKTQTPNETFGACNPTGMLRWHDWDRRKLLEKGCFIGPQPLWRRDVHDVHGFFCEEYSVSADYEFWLRISQPGNFYHINTPLGLYLDRPDSIEHRQHERKLMEDNIIRAIYQNADRRNDSNSMKLTQGGRIMYPPENILSAIRYLADSEHKNELGWFLDKLIADFPDMAEAHSERGQAAYALNDMSTAQKHFELAAELAPDSYESQKNLGDFRYAVQNDGPRSLMMYTKALSLKPDSLDTLILAGHVAVSLHQFDQAQMFYSRAIGLAPENEDIRKCLEKLQRRSVANQGEVASVADLMASAQESVAKGDRQGAISTLEEVVLREPENALAHNDLGVLFYEQSLKDKALDHYQTAAKLAPENNVFQKNLADLYWCGFGDARNAMESYVQALKLDPQDVESLLGCARVCMETGRNDDACIFLNCILEMEPWNEDARQMMTRLEMSVRTADGDFADAPNDTSKACRISALKEDPQGAIENLMELIVQSPHDARAFNDLGVLHFETGNKSKALYCYEQAVKLQPRQPNFVKNLADFYLMEQGRVQEALKLYVNVLEDNPEDIDCLISTGLICSVMGKIEDARHFYQRALEIEPWNQIAGEAMNKLDNIPQALSDDSEIKIATA